MSNYDHPRKGRIVLGAIAVITAVASLTGGAYEEQLSKPNDELRDAVWDGIDQVVQLHEQQRERASRDPSIQGQINEIVTELKALVPETEMLITYILQYQAREDTGEKEWISSMGVLKGLTLNLDDRKFIGVLLPLVETDDERLYDVAQDFLGPFIRCECNGIRITFGAFDDYLRQRKQEVPRGLVRFMYSEAPGKGLLRLGGIHSRSQEEYRPLFWAEHEVSDILWKWQFSFVPRNQVEAGAAEALSKLVDHPRWWARLYVAEIMRQHPAFRTDELIAVLLTDPDESVRSVVTSFVRNNAQDDC